MTTSPDRQTFRQTVALVAAKAKERLPQAVNGRIESAVKLVLAGDVFFCDDGTVEVGSSDPTRYYKLVGPTCTCTDFTSGKAPDGWCKHRTAAGISKRVQEVLSAQPPTPQPVEPPVEPWPDNDPEPAAPAPAPLPEAPASVNCHITLAGRQVQLTLRDTDEGRLLARLAAVLQHYPVEPKPQPQGQPQGEGFCVVHNVSMKQTTKDGRSWYSHRKEDGSWCKGRK